MLETAVKFPMNSVAILVLLHADFCGGRSNNQKKDTEKPEFICNFYMIYHPKNHLSPMLK